VESVGSRVKLGVVSDVHNHVDALGYALQHMQGCETVLSLGDLVSEYRVDPEIIRLAREHQVLGILGNHEKTILMHPGSRLREHLAPDDLRYLLDLPANRQLSAAGRQVAVAHGAPWDDPQDYRCEYVFARDAAQVKRLRAVPADIILLGHTHVPMTVRLDDRLIVNPGSCGEGRDTARRATYAILDFDASEATVFEIQPGADPRVVTMCEL
jgi:putative phosphoesterase